MNCNAKYPNKKVHRITSPLAATLSFLALFSGQNPAQAAVRIFVGYLPEEVNGVITTLVQNSGKRKIIAIGDSLAPDNVFGINFWVKPRIERASRPTSGISSWSPTGSNRSVDPRSTPSRPTNAAEQIAETLKQHYEDDLNIDAAGRPKGTRWQAPWGGFDVAQFPDASRDSRAPAKYSNGDDLVVVIKPSVNGRAPKDLRNYLHFVFTALASLPQAAKDKGGIHLSSFGTAGGISVDKGPDEELHVKTSLFVGALPTKNGRSLATIQLATLGDKNPPVVIYLEEFWSDYQAETAAHDIFKAWSHGTLRAHGLPNPIGRNPCPPADLHASYVINDGNKYVNPITAAAIKNLMIKDGNTSLTVSVFADPSMKEAASRLGLTNVNMEDFHIMELANAADPVFRSTNIDRVISDPAALPAEALNAYRDWLANGSYSREQYVESILWALKGRSIWTAPTAARWNVFDKFPPERSRKWISQVPFTDAPGPIDPLFADMTAQIMNRMTSYSFDLSDYVPTRIKDTLSRKAWDQLKDLVSPRTQEVRRLARDLDTAGPARTPADETALRPRISEIVDKLATIAVTQDPLRKEMLEINKADPNSASVEVPLLASSAGPGRMRVWHTDRGRTYNIRDESVGIMGDRNPTDEEIYRRLYKLTLLGLGRTNTYQHTISEMTRMDSLGKK